MIAHLGDEELVLELLGATQGRLRHWRRGAGAKKEARQRPADSVGCAPPPLVGRIGDLG